MKITRLVVKNFRAFTKLDVNLVDDITCIIGENNTGKTALLRAIQMCLDVSLPGYFRSLQREDIHSSVDISEPNQVLIGIELSDFEGKVNEEALVSTWKTGEDTARIFYRFRPRRHIIEKLSSGEIQAGTLTLEDYNWEIKAGGDPAVDLADIDWDDEDVGEGVRFGDLQSYLVVALPALRDVEADIRNFRVSPIIKLIESFDIGETEQNALIEVLKDANDEISDSATIKTIAETLDKRFKDVAGPAFEMGVGLGISSPTFQSIVRNLRMLLSDLSLADFEPSRNGLGMNNILYIAILIEYLKKRIEKNNTAGQVLLIEEPEAHLHPQLQASLMIALSRFGTQVIITSHSTQITSHVPFSSLISLTKKSDGSLSCSTLIENEALEENDVADLERYLDATKSNILYARKVMLVEGAAELFLIPALVKKVKGIELERSGISVVAIHGVHFEVYAKLFRANSLEKKCAIVADADLKPSDMSDGVDIEVQVEYDSHKLAQLKGDYIEVFLGATTFERELVSIGTLPMLIETVKALGAPQITKSLEDGLKFLTENDESPETMAVLEDLKTKVLNTSKRFGKARFAQVATRYVDRCTEMPKYIDDAINWLLNDTSNS